MIKSTVKQSTSKVEFPRLMVGTTGVVVLFSSAGIGSVVERAAHWREGDYSKTWDPDAFTDFTGTLTLSNGS